MSADTQQQITAAIGAHGQWKSRLKTAVAQGSSDVTAAAASRDNACAFGTWLYNDASAEVKASPHYATCRSLHAAFHKEAGSVLELALAGKKTEAEAKLAMDSDFAHASAALTRAMSLWAKEA